MMTKWTDEQLNAICENRGSLLVSAAAGSGKTAVLVERVIRKLTDNEKPIDIDKFLLVTYTNAAAAEMRSKIAQAITKKLSVEPQNTRLRKQLILIHKAQIATVHSFCLNIVREQFSFFGLSPDFRIADEWELFDIKQDVIEEVLEDGYKNQDEGFLFLSDLLSNGKDDKRFCNVILEIFEKIQSHEQPFDFLDRIFDMFSSSDGAEIHCEILVDEARILVQHGIKCLEIALEELESSPQLKDAYAQIFENDILNAKKLLDAMDNGFEDAVLFCRNIKHLRLASVRGYEDENFQEYIKSLRKEWKVCCEKILQNLLCETKKEYEDCAKILTPAMRALISIVKKFSIAYSDEKIRRNVVDFGDLEHFALKLLIQDGKPTELALSIASGFNEIMVDEYQDTNFVQEAIFNAVSKDGTNLFFVGDVKQSIYGFRLANPHIFLEKYNLWADAVHADDMESRKLNLTMNFRSRKKVLQTVNYIFSNIMSRQLGDLDYTEKEALYEGANYPDCDNKMYNTEVMLLDTSNIDDDAPEKSVLEAQMVAKKIKSLLDSKFPIYDKDMNSKRDILAGDIVILLRSISRKAVIFKKAIEQFGLSAETDETAGLISTTEVSSIISMLHIIDNPRQDVELVGVLRSPLFGFCEQELAEIRLVDREIDFYDALKLAYENGNKKVVYFIDMLLWFRNICYDIPVCALIEKIFEKTDAMGLFGAMPNGRQRQQNLLAFFERARDFEKNSLQGLFKFNCLIRSMIERGEDWNCAHIKGDSAVRIISIHKSKGLEFPVVFLCDCAKAFNEQDLHEPVLVHSQLGFGPKCRDIDNMVQYPTIWRRAIAVKSRRDAISEELRVLYVALTRAKEKLIITASSSRLESEIKKLNIIAKARPFPTYPLTRMRSYLGWILLPFMTHKNGKVVRDFLDNDDICIDSSVDDFFDIFIVKPSVDENFDVIAFEQNDFKQLDIEIDFDKSKNDLIDIPSKLTATGLKESFKALETKEDTPYFDVLKNKRKFRQPDFEIAEKGLTPTEKGTAHHLFMQFCDFEKCFDRAGLENELRRLRDMFILSNAQADAVNLDKIFRFFNSKLYLNDFKSGYVRREFKFSVVLPVSKYYENLEKYIDEKVLLQGVIDCLIEFDNYFIIVDFKTDNVFGDALHERARDYKPQILAYAEAVEHIFDKKVKKVVLYFLSCGKAVETVL